MNTNHAKSLAETFVAQAVALAQDGNWNKAKAITRNVWGILCAHANEGWADLYKSELVEFRNCIRARNLNERWGG